MVFCQYPLINYSGTLTENVSIQRKTPAPPIRQSSAVGVDPYLHPSSGIPLYKYRYSKYHGNMGCRVMSVWLWNFKYGGSYNA